MPRFDDAEPNGVVFANLAAAARRFLEIDLCDGGEIRLPGTRDAHVRASQSTHSISLIAEEASHAAVA